MSRFSSRPWVYKAYSAWKTRLFLSAKILDLDSFPKHWNFLLNRLNSKTFDTYWQTLFNSSSVLDWFFPAKDEIKKQFQFHFSHSFDHCIVNLEVFCHERTWINSIVYVPISLTCFSWLWSTCKRHLFFCLLSCVPRIHADSQWYMFGRKQTKNISICITKAAPCAFLISIFKKIKKFAVSNSITIQKLNTGPKDKCTIEQFKK